MTVVDAHHHLWDPAIRRYPFLEPERLAPIRRAYTVDELRRRCSGSGIDRTVLVQTVSDIAETTEFLRLAEGSHGLIAGVVGWVDLTDPAVSDTIAMLRDGPGGHLLVGIRHPVQGEDDPQWLTRPDVVRGLRAVAEANLVYDLLVKAEQLPLAVAAVQQVEEGRFVLDHAAKPAVSAGDLFPWAGRLAQLARHPNVSCKLSGLVTEADWIRWSVDDLHPFAEVVFDAFGAGRVMFGTDWPVCEVAASHRQVVETARTLIDRLAPQASGEIFGATAIARYGLSPA